jgi:type VI secretion system secreted protein Hcp
MANQDMFMKIDGVKGCTLDSAEKGSIDLLDWNWGLVQTGSSHHMSGSGEGKVIAHDLTFTKYQDASSATIYQFCDMLARHRSRRWR